MSKRILIIGGSGFIGQILYKELAAYFDVYATYAYQEALFKDNQVFFKFIAEENTITPLLEILTPTLIISAFKATSPFYEKTHQEIGNYVLAHNCKLIYISSVEVFNAKGNFPSYEKDFPLSHSTEGKQKIVVEKIIQGLPEETYTLVRLPMVLGINSLHIEQLKQAIKHQATFEVYPNLIVSATTQHKIAQQIHYIINKKLVGIFHLTSEDLVHHDELFIEIAKKISAKKPIFKNVFSSNEDQFLALLSRDNSLPKHKNITIEQVIADSTLKDEIISLKNSL